MTQPETKTVRPIKPADVVGMKRQSLPPEVIEVFNRLIALAWDGYSARVRQDDAKDGITQALGISVDDAYKRRLLDVEEVYRAEGWDVVYDSPGVGEAFYEPYFLFKADR